MRSRLVFHETQIDKRYPPIMEFYSTAEALIFLGRLAERHDFSIQMPETFEVTPYICLKKDDKVVVEYGQSYLNGHWSDVNLP